MNKIVGFKEKKIECIVFSLFAISLAVVSFFHEPWFDEAEAWQIARCASLKQILFDIPHYEGHPALWHLLLLIPAKLGFPYEFCLGVIIYIAIFFTGWLILFRSPFPLVVRCLLPFHYFIFYQNGVVSRPYGYMTLAFMLMACFFKDRKERPWRFVISLAFLCALSGYGIVLAGGVAAAWTMEICVEKQWKFGNEEFWKDKRIYSLAALLIVAFALIFQIMPRENTFAFSIDQVNPIWLSMLYSFLAMIPDAFLLNILSCEDMPRFSALNSTQFYLALVIGLFFLVIVWLFATKKNRNYFFIPYLFFAIFTGIVYFSAHHMGIMVAFVVFWFWIAFEDKEKGASLARIFGKIKLSEQDAETLRKFSAFICLIPLVVPCVWTAVASVNDVQYDYFNARGITKFIKEHHLENAKFLVEWGEVTDENWSDEEYYEKVNAYGLDVSVDPVAVMPYFDHNFCINLNGGRDDVAYATHHFATAEESKEVFRQLREQGAPDFVVGIIDLDRIYGSEVSMKDYVPVYKISPRYISIWKFFRTFGDSFKTRYIYARKDILDQYGLENILGN